MFGCKSLKQDAGYYIKCSRKKCQIVELKKDNYNGTPTGWGFSICETECSFYKGCWIDCVRYGLPFEGQHWKYGMFSFGKLFKNCLYESIDADAYLD